MKKVVLVAFAAILAIGFSGCGRLDRFSATVTGAPSEICVDGVLYLQFTSGATEKYLPTGQIATCPK